MQLNLDFEPGITERHKTILSCIRESAYKNNKALKAIAADMDVSESDLSRKLSGNPDDPRRMTVDDLVRFIEVTGDMSAVNWLIEKFHLNDGEKVSRAAQEFMRQLPGMVAMAKQMGVKL